jgi:cytochrome c oxidase subunit 1
VFTYPAASGWGTLNLLATIGGVVLGLGVLLVLVNAARSRKALRAAADPWDADTLEWSVASPPPPENFVHLPTVGSRSPRWDDPPDQPVVVGVRDDDRQLLVTTVLDAQPDHKHIVPGPSIWPLLCALGVGLGVIVAIFTPWGVPVGMVLGLAALAAWFWPKPPHQELAEEQPRSRSAA